MTTIAWRDGVIASDRQSINGKIPVRCTKLFRTKEYAIGVAGSLSYGIAFVNWFQGDRSDECPLDEITAALVMNLETGACEQWEAPGVGIPVEDDFEAIGSGAAVAIGAMEMGATAKEAIRIASKRDTGTGMGIQVIKAK